jgi:hypothetical protein
MFKTFYGRNLQMFNLQMFNLQMFNLQMSVTNKKVFYQCHKLLLVLAS